MCCALSCTCTVNVQVKQTNDSDAVFTGNSPRCQCQELVTWWRTQWPKMLNQAVLKWPQGRWWTPILPLHRHRNMHRNVKKVWPNIAHVSLNTWFVSASSALTFRCHIFYVHPVLVSHVTEHGEDGKPWEETGDAVHSAGQESIPADRAHTQQQKQETLSRCYSFVL